MDRQTLRDWVIRFNAAGVEGLGDRPRSGRRPFLGEGQMAAFKALVLRGPDPERDGVSSWTAKDLCRLVEERFGVSYSENGMLDLLHGLNLSWQKTRPVLGDHAQLLLVGEYRLAQLVPPVVEQVHAFERADVTSSKSM
jgi:transposase